MNLIDLGAVQYLFSLFFTIYGMMTTCDVSFLKFGHVDWFSCSINPTHPSYINLCSPKKKRSFSKVAFLLEKSAGWWNGPNVTLRKKESQNCCPRRAIWAVWSSITQLSMKLHFGALFSEVEPLSLQTWLWTKKNGSPLQKRADFQNYSPREPFSFFSQWPSRRGFIF